MKLLTTLSVTVIFFFICSCASYTPYNKDEKQLVGEMIAASFGSYYGQQQREESDSIDEINGEMNDNPAEIIIGVPVAIAIGGLWMKPEARQTLFKSLMGINIGLVIYNHEQGVR